MGTPYSDIYAKYEDNSRNFLLQNATSAEKSATLKSKMITALGMFTGCKQDLSDRDDNLEEFNITLTQKEIDIIVSGMKYVFSSDFIGDTDFIHTMAGKGTPANMQRANKETNDYLRKQFYSQLREYYQYKK